MNSYISRSGKQSGVTGYIIGEDHIVVEFRGGTKYKYSHFSCGQTHVTNMISRANSQQGLSTYISQLKPEYESKQ